MVLPSKSYEEAWPYRPMPLFYFHALSWDDLARRWTGWGNSHFLLILAAFSVDSRASCLFVEDKLREDVACEVNNMSTRGCIARLQRKAPLEFKGVYHHWDSYPSGLGRTLFRIRRQDFNGDTNAMLNVLIDQHGAGWSTIVGRDFTLTPGFRGASLSNACAKGEDARPECYCHGSRDEEGWAVTHENAAGSGIEYAYVFDGSKMLVVGSFRSNGVKMVGMFGMGDPGATWSVIAAVDLNGPEPDWSVMEPGVHV